MSVKNVVTGVTFGVAVLSLALSVLAFQLAGQERVVIQQVPVAEKVTPSPAITASPSASVAPTKKVFVPVKTAAPSVAPTN